MSRFTSTKQTEYKYILPIDTIYIKSNESLMCINTHNINVLIGLIDTVKTQPWNLFAYIGLTGAWIEQYDARDFCLLSDNDPSNVSNRLEGCPVLAIADGEVVYSKSNIFPYGNCVCIKHSGISTYSTYCHMSKGSVIVKKGDIVKQGDVIGKIGNTGNSTAPHLHFEMTVLPFNIGKSLVGFKPYTYIELKDTDLWGVEDFSRVVDKHKTGKWKTCKDGVLKDLCILK